MLRLFLWLAGQGQPPPQALRFSQSRGERLVMNRKGPWEGYRRQAKPVVSFPPSFARTFSSRERDVWVRGRGRDVHSLLNEIKCLQILLLLASISNRQIFQSQRKVKWEHESTRTGNFFSPNILLTISPKKLNVKTGHGPVSYFYVVTSMLAHVLHAYSGALSREKRAHQSSMGKKVCISSTRAFRRGGRKIKQQQSRVFLSTKFWCLHWVTEKELERERKREGDQFRWKKNMKILKRRWENEKC